MDERRWLQVKEVFQRAIEQPAAERIRWVERECGDDKELLAEVLSLLESDLEGTEFLKVPRERTPPETAESPFPTFPSPARYRVVEKIGEGGMGEVFHAEQLEPVRRRVALKVIKRGMDTKEVIARFETERQALALMNHRSIARVFDAGSTAQGRPYFAMEYVDGIPITDYCDRHRLDPKQRIELFRTVCSAVQHAHQKGIIHRDLKPSNILVRVEAGRPVPKVIDFGISKATSQRLTEKTLFTQRGQWVGTPEYMSPEQAEAGGLDIDTRTDVYSLGVVLYELLVGAKPFDPATLRRAGFDEVRRVIREEEPPKPSTRFTSLGDDSSTAARNRRVEPEALQRVLRGDLDAIAMKALEKDRTLRYGSPQELSEDIGRFLNDEPVSATPPSALYRTRKFVRRHRLAVAAATAVAAAVLAGSAVALWQARIAHLERARAERRFDEVRALANSVVYEIYDGIEELPGSTPVRELVVRRAEEYLGSLAAEAHDDIELQKELAGARLRIGDVLGAPYHASLGDYTSARANYLQAVEMLESAVSTAPDDPEIYRLLTDGRLNLGRIELVGGNSETALATFAKAREAIRRGLALEPGNTAHLGRLSTVNEAIAVLHETGGNFRSALAIHRENLELDLARADARPDDLDARRNVAIARGRLAATLEVLGNTAGAAEELRMAVKGFESILVEQEHHAGVQRELAAMERDLARQLGTLGSWREAEEKLASAEAAIGELRSLDPENQILIGDLGVAYHVAGRLAWAQGNTDEALRRYESALEVASTLAPEVFQSIEVQSYLLKIHLHRGEALEGVGDAAGALLSYRKAVQTGDSAFGDDNLRRLGSIDLAAATARLAAAILTNSSAAAGNGCDEAADSLAASRSIRGSLNKVGSPVGWPNEDRFAQLLRRASSCAG